MITNKHTVEFNLTIILEFHDNKILNYQWKDLNEKQQQWFELLDKNCNINQNQEINLENATINNSYINKLKKDLDKLKIIVTKDCPKQLKVAQNSIVKLSELINEQLKKIQEQTIKLSEQNTKLNEQDSKLDEQEKMLIKQKKKLNDQENQLRELNLLFKEIEFLKEQIKSLNSK